MFSVVCFSTIAACLLGFGRFEANPRETRQQYLWSGACLLMAVTIPNGWLAVLIGMIGLSCLWQVPPGFASLAIPAVLAWIGMYSILSVSMSLGLWVSAWKVAVCTGALSGIYSCIKRWKRVHSDNRDRFEAEIRIPFTRNKLRFYDRGWYETGFFDNSSVAEVGFALMLPAAVALAQAEHWAWVFAMAPIAAGLFLARERGAVVTLWAGAAGYLLVQSPRVGLALLCAGLSCAVVLGVRYASSKEPYAHYSFVRAIHFRWLVIRETAKFWRCLPWMRKLIGAGPWGWWLWLGCGRPNFGQPLTPYAQTLQDATDGLGWEQAHNEWVQAAFEHGVWIVVPILGFLGSALWHLIGVGTPWAAATAGGLAVLAVSAGFLFPLRVVDTAVLVLLWLVGTALIR